MTSSAEVVVFEHDHLHACALQLPVEVSGRVFQLMAQILSRTCQHEMIQKFHAECHSDEVSETKQIPRGQEEQASRLEQGLNTLRHHIPRQRNMLDNF